MYAVYRLDDVEAAARAQWDIQLQDIRFEGADLWHGVIDGAGFGDHGEVGERREQAGEFGARRGFVVDDDDGVSQKAAGKVKVARVPLGRRGSRAKLCAPGNSSSRRRTTFEMPVPDFTDSAPTPIPSSLTM